ncbi:MAG: hypothetical protein KDN19_08175 [Verrucomicrobiae bacterium]|nr:hypothetical protein [Verrucomicrobiae bacterium]
MRIFFIALFLMPIAGLGSAHAEETKKVSARQEVIDDLKGLHGAMVKYLEKNKSWPRLPAGEENWEEEKFFAFWFDALKDFGATPDLWRHSSEPEGVKMSYVPSQFSPGPATPYRWKQPWFTPRQSFGGEMMVLLPDGAVISLPHLMQYDYRSPKAEE